VETTRSWVGAAAAQRCSDEKDRFGGSRPTYLLVRLPQISIRLAWTVPRPPLAAGAPFNNVTPAAAGAATERGLARSIAEKSGLGLKSWKSADQYRNQAEHCRKQAERTV